MVNTDILSEAPVEQTEQTEQTQTQTQDKATEVAQQVDVPAVEAPTKEESILEADTDEATPEVEEVILPEQYELPEGMTLIEGFEDKVQELGKDLKLDQANFDKLTGMYTEIETARVEAEHKARMEAVSSVMKPEQLKSFEAKAKATFGEDYEILRDAASGSTTAVASVLKLVQKHMMKSEHSLSHHIQTAPSITEGDLREMMRDPRYKTDADYRSKVSAGFSQLYS